MTTRSQRIAVSVLAACALLGCGESKNAAPPHAPTSGASDGGAETFAEVHPDDVAALSSTAPAGAASGTPGKGAPPARDSEPEDTCTPAGVDYEKAVRPKLKACYRDAKVKTPALEGAARFVLDVDTLGKPKPVRVTEKSLPEAVIGCMMKAFKATPFTDAGKCNGKSLTIPVAFPTPP